MRSCLWLILPRVPNDWNYDGNDEVVTANYEDVTPDGENYGDNNQEIR